MEFVNMFEIEEFQSASIVKKIPIMTDQMVATLICIDKQKETISHVNQDFDEFHLVLSGSGKISIGNISVNLKEGMLVFVPRTETHCFSTKDDRLTVLTISPLLTEEIGFEAGLIDCS